MMIRCLKLTPRRPFRPIGNGKKKDVPSPRKQKIRGGESPASMLSWSEPAPVPRARHPRPGPRPRPSWRKPRGGRQVGRGAPSKRMCAEQRGGAGGSGAGGRPRIVPKGRRVRAKSGTPSGYAPRVAQPATAAAPEMQHQGGKMHLKRALVAGINGDPLPPTQRVPSRSAPALVLRCTVCQSGASTPCSRRHAVARRAAATGAATACPFPGPRSTRNNYCPGVRAPGV